MQEDQAIGLDRLAFASEETAFYSRLGANLTQWAELEMALCGLFARLLSKASYEAAAAAFYGPDHFHSRFQMTDAVALQVLTGARLEEWKFLRERIRRAAKWRNKIAHGQCIILPDAIAGRRFKLRDPIGDPSSPEIGDYNTGLHFGDLQEISKRFNSVSAAISCLLQRVDGQSEQLRELVLEDDYRRVEDPNT